MNKGLALLLIGLFFGTGFGFLLSASSGAQLTGHDHGAHDHAAHDHGAGQPVLTETGAETSVAIRLTEDGPQSRNLEIVTSNFTFAPEAANGPHVPGQGHAHVYLDGVKLARAYGPWMHLQALPKGRHILRVTLNGNDHSQLAIAGVPVEATQELIIE